MQIIRAATGRLLLGIVALTWILGRPAVASGAPIIEFQATDLADLNVVEDLWTYDYAVSGFPFAANQGFSIYFVPTLYQGLSDGTAPSADWDLVLIQPSLLLPDDGRFDALLLNGASLGGVFSVKFVWLGARGTTPGKQSFTIDEFDAQGNFLGTIQDGQTRPFGVPEPATLLLLMSGLAATAWRRQHTQVASHLKENKL